jgi:Tol biopolymer transport system component
MNALRTFAGIVSLCFATASALCGQSHHGHEPTAADTTDEFVRAMVDSAVPVLSWTPRGAMLVASSHGAGKTVRLVEKAGAPPRRFAAFGGPVTGLAVDPDPTKNGILYARPDPESGAAQILYVDLTNGSKLPISDGASLDGAAIWSPDGDRIAYSTSRRDGADWHLRLADREGGESPPILEREGRWIALDWSADGQRLLVGRFLEPDRFHPFLMEVDERRLIPLHDSRHPVVYSAARFTADGEGIYYIPAENDEVPQLRRRTLRGDDEREITGGHSFGVTRFDLSPDGRTLAYVTDDNGVSALRLYDVESGRASRPETPEGEILEVSFSPDGQRLGWVVRRPDSEVEIFALDPASEDPEIEMWLGLVEIVDESHDHHEHNAHNAHNESDEITHEGHGD